VKPVISDAELNKFAYRINHCHWEESSADATREALAAFLLARMPEPLRIDADTPPGPASRYAAYNECRAQVLRGKE